MNLILSSTNALENSLKLSNEVRAIIFSQPKKRMEATNSRFIVRAARICSRTNGQIIMYFTSARNREIVRCCYFVLRDSDARAEISRKNQKQRFIITESLWAQLPRSLKGNSIKVECEYYFEFKKYSKTVLMHIYPYTDIKNINFWVLLKTAPTSVKQLKHPFL